MRNSSRLVVRVLPYADPVCREFLKSNGFLPGLIAFVPGSVLWNSVSQYGMTSFIKTNGFLLVKHLLITILLFFMENLV